MLAQARILNHQAVAFDFDEKLNETTMEELQKAMMKMGSK